MESSATQTHKQLLAAYGSLRKGYFNNPVLGRSKYIGSTFIKGTMYDLGAFPCVTLDDRHEIYIEIFEVDDNTLDRCDTLEGVPYFYQRSTVETLFGPAFIYTLDMSDGYFKDKLIVKDGMWKPNDE